MLTTQRGKIIKRHRVNAITLDSILECERDTPKEIDVDIINFEKFRTVSYR